MASAQNTVTIKGYAIAEGVAGYGGGTITVTGRNASINRLGISSWKDASSKTGTEVSTTAKEAFYDGWLSDYTAGIQVKLNASANDGFYFAGFAMSNTLTPSITPASLPWTSSEITYGTTSVAYYAIFKRIISVTNIDDISVWTENGSLQSDPAVITAKAHGAKDGSQMTITLIDDPDYANDDIAITNFQLYDANGTTITSSGTVTYSNTGEFTFKVGYVGTMDMAALEGKYASVKLSFGTDEKIIHIKLSPLPSVTFKGTNGKGTYSATVLTGFDTNSNGSETVQLNNTTLKGITLQLLTDPTDKQIFYGWQVTHASGAIEILSNGVEITRDLSNGDIIEPIFVPNTCGYMVMRDDGEMNDGFLGMGAGWQYKMIALSMHHDLQDALNTASVGQFVVFENLATIFSKFSIKRPAGFEPPSDSKEGVLPYREGGYNIPKGITLLIPGGTDYKYAIDAATAETKNGGEGYSGEGTPPLTYFTPNGCYRKLKVAENTTIRVAYGANISVYATVYCLAQWWAGLPDSYGQIELGKNSQIILGDPNSNTSSTDGTAGLYALGYVTNAEETTAEFKSSYGKVVAYAGAQVHEIFQYTDWRGGTVAQTLVNDKKVFPILQYYVQNVEAPIEYYKGATGTMVAIALVSDMCVKTNATFIGSIENSDGLFLLGDNAKLIKFYNRRDDTQRYIVQGTATTPAKAEIGNVKLNFNAIIMSVNIASSQFPLPLTPNIDIELDNVKLSTKYDMILLAGSSMYVDDDAEVHILDNNGKSASVYVYDKDQALYSNKSYYGSKYGQKLTPIYYTPNASQSADNTTQYNPTTYKRTYAKLQDAKINVKGKIVVGSSYGSISGLYTTEGKAQIYSKDPSTGSPANGKIKFYSIGAKTTSDQYVHGTEYVTFNITNAWLMNHNNSYVSTQSATTGTLYTHTGGVWKPSTAWDIPTELIATMPTMCPEADVTYELDRNDTYLNGTNFTATVAGTGFSFVDENDQPVSSVTVPYDANGPLKVKVRYTPQNIHDNVINGEVTFKNVKYPSITATSGSIPAKETYVPEFSIDPTYIVFPDITRIGYSSDIKASETTFKLNTVLNNVTSLISDDTYYKHLSWKSVSNNPEFSFTFGEGKNALSDAKITFTPTSAGTKSATITLTATYTDASSPSKSRSSANVTLQVTAEAKALETNNFTLTDVCQSELMNMCVGIPVTLEFQGLTANTNLLDFDIANNGAVGSEVLKLSREGTVYTITATSVPADPADMPTITISQESDGTYATHTTIAYPTKIQNCIPSVQWNWSDLYVGESYNTPYTTNGDGNATLTLDKVTKAGVEVAANQVITYNSTTKTATILSDLTDEYIATFTFSQEATASFSPFTTTFTAAIYPRPNVLPVCVESEREFKGLTSANKDASFLEDNQVVFAANASWTMHFEGVPNVLSFTPTATTQLLVQESANGSAWDNTSLYEQVVAGTPYEVELLPTTRYVKFTVVQASNLQNICVSEFANMVRSNTEILYMPISADPINDPTTRTITFTHANDKEMSIMKPDDNFTVTPDELPATPSGFAQTTVTITSKATTEYNPNLRVVTISGATQTDKLIIPIETYRFPQKLPIQLENGKDPAKRFYYVTTLYKDVEWDAANYAINLKKRTSDVDDKPYVTFAFDGAPSFISFVPLVDNNLSNWEIKESDGTIWNTPEQTPTLADGVLKQTLRHNTRYVSVTYVGNNMDVVKMTKVNILTAQGAIPSVEELNLTEANKYTTELSVGADLNITTVNITNMTISVDNPHFTLSYNGKTPDTKFENISGIANVFGEDVVGELPFEVFWNAAVASDFATITITTQNGAKVDTLATVSLIGNANTLSANAEIWTGVDPTKHALLGSFAGIDAIEGNDGTDYCKVKLENAYDEAGKALFDYLIIYGETTTTDGQRNITTPTTKKGSNAKTPMYVYMRVDDQYQFAAMEENVNSGTKMFSSLPVEAGTTLRVYITGFCPYASTGYTKSDEGVWYFKGHNNANLEIYLDDCYIYSRNKTPDGHSFSGRGDGQSFTEAAVRGSGGVLVFENQDDDLDQYFNVTIHTNGNNMFKSTYGCFFELIEGLRVYQVSSPIQVHLAVDQEGVDYKNSGTILSFDDKWPTNSADYSQTKRTNGRLSLQKQHNNAPSIDLGNSQTIVEFNGGQVELQNAAVVSQNYKTTFAISFRGGQFAGFDMALGIGTDDTGGTIRFKDGTTTVIPLWVDEVYKNYYLIDEDENGPITRQYEGKTQYRTSCLRCPTATRVTGGSHCMMRACSDPTSLGGAPKNASGDPLGLYRYPQHPAEGHRGGWTAGDNKLVIPTDVPGGYGVASVTPNYGANNVMDPIPGTAAECDDYLNFWFTKDQEASVAPEQEGNKYSYWKASVTQLKAEFMGYKREVGGPEDAQITEGEVVANLLYCQLDQNMHDVISEKDIDGNYTYSAPVKMPTDQLGYDYASIKPSVVGEELQNYVVTVKPHPTDDNADPISDPRDYEILDKVYYIMPASADVWMTFVPPFDVEKLWVVETIDEQKLIDYAATHTRQEVLKLQAKHNADFATFFAVTIALQYDKPFEQMYQEYLSWAREQDGHTGAASDYAKRGKIQLVHYNGNNWRNAHYYLYKNTENWEFDGENGQYITKWQVVPEVAPNQPIMQQGKVYSFLLPYCQGCDVEANPDGTIKLDEFGLPITTQRDYWDYWSGKLLIFESTQKSISDPHKIKGENYHEELLAISEPGETILTGNSTFSLMQTKAENADYLLLYTPTINYEAYEMILTEDGKYPTIQPTISFMKENLLTAINSEQSLYKITHSGKVIYGPKSGNDDNDDNSEAGSGNTPTIGGDNTLFITTTQWGINVAVKEPQFVRVISATGTVIYSGMVHTAVDVTIPTTGVYMVAGENEVQKLWIQ